MGVVLVAVPYFSTNNIASMYLDTVWDPEIALDRELPVVNWMILPYTLLYLFYPATLILCPRSERGQAELAVGMQTLIMVTAFCCAIFLLLPAEIDMRDQIDWDSLNGWEYALFEFIHLCFNTLGKGQIINNSLEVSSDIAICFNASDQLFSHRFLVII